MRDAVILFTLALKDMAKNFTTTTIQCDSPESKWELGPEIMGKMKSASFLATYLNRYLPISDKIPCLANFHSRPD